MRSLVVLLVLAAPAAARAQAEAGSRQREHDGFFLRVALGGSGLSMKREGSLRLGSAGTGTGSSEISGGAGVGELSIGGAIAKGLVLSGTLLAHSHSEPTLDVEGGGTIALDGPLTFAVVGASLEYFPDPRGGFHFGGTIGVAGAWVKSPPPSFTEYL